MGAAIEIEARAASAAPWTLRRVVTAGVIGNVLEWYDFAVYGFFAPILAAQFFPAEDPRVSLLAAFAAFAVGFLMRPVGAAIFGHIGDRYGRARALLFSIAMMAMPTVLMGLLPTYETIGIAASVLIVVLRMCQGIAVGGEFTASIVFLAENAPPRRRGFFASFSMFGATTGTMLGSAVGALLTNVMSAEALASWGWRAAFISGIAVAVVGIVIRRGMFDSPSKTAVASPLAVAFRDHRWQMLRVLGLNVASAATYYTLFVYAATWVSQTTTLPRAVALNITTVTILTFLVVLPVAAWLSDRFGRKLMLCRRHERVPAAGLSSADRDARGCARDDGQRADGVRRGPGAADGVDPGSDDRDVSARSARQRRQRRLRARVRTVRRHGTGGGDLADQRDRERHGVRVVPDGDSRLSRSCWL